MVTSPMPRTQDDVRLLLTAARLVQHRQDEALAPLRLTRTAVIALEAVALSPMNQEQLAQKAGIRSQTLGRVITRVEGEGLVTRTRNPADKRQFLVQITTAGKTALEAATQTESVAIPNDFDGWDNLRELLTQLIETFQAPARPPSGDTEDRNN
ncbi:MarR family transcriptional regulator [Arthrobacter sp. H35-D1]|uniref:MarR family winged helix-turn-helix transcriptional regulator n=1 Tax=Arthrobacter sp. H35-D1 TaxID=3046202 RepID=UPI0024BBAE00|nr:MarR family transcriptional regulator [Arthrobacter sp. H35-D1]MDJ0315248.1 MarR family transcriptional regulator [Arthrobacter sp. H35-D1]